MDSAELAAMRAERDAALAKSNDAGRSMRERMEWAEHAAACARAIRRAEAGE